MSTLNTQIVLIVLGIAAIIAMYKRTTKTINYAFNNDQLTDELGTITDDQIKEKFIDWLKSNDFIFKGGVFSGYAPYLEGMYEEIKNSSVSKKSMHKNNTILQCTITTVSGNETAVMLKYNKFTKTYQVQY